jgi:hypothetical protein
MSSKTVLKKISYRSVRSKFKVGDDVFDPRYGWMKVFRKQRSSIYSLECRSIDEVLVTYTVDGRYMPGDFSPCLFTKEEALIKFPEFVPSKTIVKGSSYYISINNDGFMLQELFYDVDSVPEESGFKTIKIKVEDLV